jgi:hypothetical protein
MVSVGTIAGGAHNCALLPMASAHGTLVNAVIAYLNARGGFAWKSASGVLPVGTRFVHTGTRGLPDVIGVWPVASRTEQPMIVQGSGLVSVTNATWYQYGPTIGRLIAVEVKTGTGRLRRHQEAMHAELKSRGALVLVIRDIADLQKALA